MSPLKATLLLAALALVAGSSPLIARSTTCSLEGRIKPAYSYHGLSSGDDNPYQCWEFCTDGRRPGWEARCQTFSYSPTEKRCELFNVSIEEGFEAMNGTGDFFFTKNCCVSGIYDSCVTLSVVL